MKIFISTLSGRVYGGASYFQNLIPEIIRQDNQNLYYIWINKENKSLLRIKTKNITFYNYSYISKYLLGRLFVEQIIIPLKFLLFSGDIIFYGKNIGSFFFVKKNIISIRNVEPFFYKDFKNTFKRNIVSKMRFELTKFFLKKSNAIIAVSEHVKNLIIKNNQIDNNKIYVIYNGCNVTDGFRSSWSPNLNSPYFLSVSKLIPYANQYNLLNGYIQFLKNCKDTIKPKLVLVGGIYDRKYYKSLIKLINRENVTDFVKLYGYVHKKKVYELASKCSIFIHPSILEACPHIIIEMMRIGAPILASKSQPMPEIADNSGDYFDPYSPRDISTTIESVYNNNDKMYNKSKIGSDISVKFQWEITADSFIKIVNKKII